MVRKDQSGKERLFLQPIFMITKGTQNPYEDTLYVLQITIVRV